MLIELSPLEEYILDMLIHGQNSNGITSWLGISYIEYSKNRKSILKKLQIKRMTEIHSYLLINKNRMTFSH